MSVSYEKPKYMRHYSSHSFWKNYSFYPRIKFESLSTTTSVEATSSQDFPKYIEVLEASFQAEMILAPAKYRATANRKPELGPAYGAGDEVWLSARNIKTLYPSLKLNWIILCQFRIQKVVSHYAYNFMLLDTMKMHPVFHVSLFDPVATNTLPDHFLPSAPLIEVDDSEEIELTDILDSSRRRGRAEYYVQ